jgi:hypothetical protein
MWLLTHLPINASSSAKMRRSRFEMTRTITFLSATLSLIMSALSATAAAPIMIVSQTELASMRAAIASLQAQVVTLKSQITVLQASPANRLTPYLSVDTNPNPGKHMTGPTITFKGVNINIVNGLNQTRSANGLGNLIIGYNEEPLGPVAPPLEAADRSGSHCIVVGSGHTFGGPASTGATSGCVVFGEFNRVVGYAQSVLGGEGNSAAYGTSNAVVGGSGNQAVGAYSSILGGESNATYGFQSTVSGGYWNTSGVDCASILGGKENSSTYYFSTIIGGVHNAATWPDITTGTGFEPITIMPLQVPTTRSSSSSIFP